MDITMEPISHVPAGCAFLQAVRSQLTTYMDIVTNDYAEAIFTHRALFTADPAGHSACAAGFAGLAVCVESSSNLAAPNRGYVEAANAFRSEGEALSRWAVR
jgi:hypothetical protein